MTLLLFLLDVPLRYEEASSNPWVPLILVSMVALVLAVGISGWPGGFSDLVQTPKAQASRGGWGSTVTVFLCEFANYAEKKFLRAIPQPNNPNQSHALKTSPTPNEVRFAMMILAKSRHIARDPSFSVCRKANQNRMHSATGAKVSATTKYQNLWSLENWSGRTRVTIG